MTTARSGHATWYCDVAVVSQDWAANTSTIQVHIWAQSDSSGWSGYAASVGFSAGYYGNGTFGFNGTHVEVVTYQFTATHDANGYCSLTIGVHINATGTQSFGGPLDWNTPITCPRIPKPPDNPGISIGSFTGRDIPVNIFVPSGYDSGGATVNSVSAQYSLNGGAYTGTLSGAWGVHTFTNLAPGLYKFRAWATNSIGNSGYTYSSQVKVASGNQVRVSGVWEAGKPKVRVGGQWVDAIMKVRVRGAWTDAR